MIFFMKAMPAGITASSFQQKCGEWSSCAGATPEYPAAAKTEFSGNL